MAGSQITTILTNVATVLASVTGVQRVHPYEPVATKPENVVAIMGGSQAVDYWSLIPETTRPHRLQGFQMEVDHVLLFQHYYEVGDTTISTPAVRTIVLAVLDKFNNTFAIVPQAEMTGPIDVDWPTVWRLADIFLVHKTVYRLPVKELYVVQ